MVESSHSGSGVLSCGSMHCLLRKSKGGKSSSRALEGDVTQLLLGPRSNHRWAYREPDLPARIGATFNCLAGHVHAPTKCTPILHQKSQILSFSSNAGITATSLQIGTYVEVAI